MLKYEIIVALILEKGSGRMPCIVLLASCCNFLLSYSRYATLSRMVKSTRLQWSGNAGKKESSQSIGGEMF